MNTNEEIFRLLIEQGFGNGDVAVFDTYTAPGFIEHQYGFIPPDVEGVKKAIRSLHHAFPDFSLTVEDIVVSGDKVWGVPDRLALMEQLGMKPPSKAIMKIISLLNR